MPAFSEEAHLLMRDVPHRLARIEALLERIDAWSTASPRRSLLVNEPVGDDEILGALNSLCELPVSTTAWCVPLCLGKPFGEVSPGWIPVLEMDDAVDHLLTHILSSPMDILLDGRYKAHLEDGISLEFRRHVMGPVIRLTEPPRVTPMQWRLLRVLRRTAVSYLTSTYRGDAAAFAGFEKLLDLFPRAVILGTRKEMRGEQTWVYATY